MSLRLFEEPGEAAESLDPAQVSLAARFLYCGWASLVAFIPVVGTIYSAFQVVRLFRSFTNAENTRGGTVLLQLHVFNTPLIVALGVAALFAFALTLVLATDSKRRAASVGFPFSIGVPVMATAPALLLWFAQSMVVDIFAGKFTGTPAQAAQTISTLLFCALGSALLMQPVIVICAIVSLCIPARSRTDAFSAPRAFVWGITATLLLVFAAAYFVLV